jgi:hypothetical protein
MLSMPGSSIASHQGSTASDRPSSNELWAAFLLGLGARLQVQIIGYLPLSEIAILLLFPVLLPKYSKLSLRNKTGMLLPLLLLWLLGAAITDVFRATEWSLAARGIARIVVYLACVPFFAWFLQRNQHAKLTRFYAGVVISAALSAYILRGGVHEGRELVYGRAVIDWKTHWQMVVLLAAGFASLLLYRRSHGLAYACNYAIGILNLSMGSRAAGGISLLGSAACAVKNLSYSKATGRQGSRRLGLASLIGVILVAGAGAAVIEGYKWAAVSGRLGRLEQMKYQMQAEHELGVVGGGRGTDIYGGLLAFYDSPLIGHGSWPLDKEGYYIKACERFNVQPQKDYYKRGYPLIPSHSHIVSAAVEHGAAGVLFYAYALFLACRAVIAPIRDSATMQLWVTTATMGVIWNTLFSPISCRMEYIMTLVVFLDQMYGAARGAVANKVSSGRASDMVAAGREAAA